MGGRQDKEVSLKQGQAVWQGLSDSSDTFPTDGTFAKLLNGYVSRDGTEIITAPGARRSGRPYYLEGGEVRGFDGTQAGAFAIGGGSAGPPATLQGLGLLSHFLKDTSTINSYLLKIDANGVVTDGYYLGRLQTNDFTVAYNGAAAAADAAGSAYFCRLPVSLTQYGSLANPYKNGDVNPFHGIEQVGNFPAIVANCLSSEADVTPGQTERRHIATWVADSVLSFDSPPEDWRCWYSVISLPFDTQRDGQQTNGFLTDGGLDMPARRRGVLDVTNDDLLIAIPGHGVCHRTAISFKNKELTAGYNVAMLGVPKAMVFSAVGVVDGSGSLTSNSTYWVSVAYKKWTTGEVGLPADPINVSLGGSDNAISVTYWSARTLVPEFSSDYSLIFFLSARNSPDSGVLQMVQESSIGINTVVGTVRSAVVVLQSTVLDRRFPRLTQHPYGASWVKTVRGLTFGGGILGSNIDDAETDFEKYAFIGTAGSDEITIDGGDNPTNSNGRLNALQRLPNGFAGFEVMISEGPNQILAGGMQRLDAQIPETTLTTDEAACKWKLTAGIPADASLGSGGEDTLKLLFPRGMVWNSEPGLPGVSPSISRTIVDRIQGRDFIGSARVGQSLLLITEKETFLFSWGRSPLGEDAVLLDDTYGCIGPNSVVEFEGSAAWLSHLGPVALQGNRVVWIGKRIADFWNDLQRDSRGLMNHAQGVHDPSRKLIMWPIRSDWGTNVTTYASQADDDVKSFFPNDEWLIWNYEVDTFQTMRFAEGRQTAVTTRMRHDDGIWRTSFVSNIVDVANMGTTAVVPRDFFDVYSLEDNFVDHRDQPLQVTATEGPNSGNFVGAVGDFTGVRKGDYAFIRTGDTVLNWHGTVGDVSTTNATDDTIEIVDPGNGTWVAGGIIEIGIMPPMELESHKMRVGEFNRNYIINSLTIRHFLERPYPVSSTFHGWVDVVVTNEKGETSTFHPALTTPVTASSSVSRVLSGSQTKLDNGDIRGNDIQVDCTFITDSIIHVKDIVLEVNQGA